MGEIKLVIPVGSAETECRSVTRVSRAVAPVGRAWVPVAPAASQVVVDLSVTQIDPRPQQEKPQETEGRGQDAWIHVRLAMKVTSLRNCMARDEMRRLAGG